MTYALLALYTTRFSKVERKVEYPNIDTSRKDVRSHTVRYDYDELILSVELPSQLFGEWELVVERPQRDGSDSLWELVPSERARCVLAEPELVGATKRATMSVRSPVVGYRYSLVSARPKSSQAATLAHESKELLRKLHDELRHGPAGGKLASVLTTTVSKALVAGFELEEGTDVGTWVAFLWDHDTRRLVPAFGQFPPRSWSARFRAGHGVAGHSFRHAKPVRWSSRTAGPDSLIYQTEEWGRPFAEKYDSVLALPLLRANDGPAVGVVSVARKTSDAGPANDAIHELASAAADSGEWGNIKTSLNAAFWRVLLSQTELSRQNRREAERALDALGLPVS